MADRKLTHIFVVPPISVLDVKQKYWKIRKNYWKEKLSDVGDMGRDKNLLKMSSLMSLKHTQTSIFDPVLCEIMYKWFTKEHDLVVDPFSGGVTRGEMAAYNKRFYMGTDIREEQVESNRMLCGNKFKTHVPLWFVGDGEFTKFIPYDFFFTCPPYLWLEKYSEDANDLSNMDEDEFYKKYQLVLNNALYYLKDDRFAAIVVSNIRRKDGSYSNLVNQTIRIFERCGMMFYNDMILLQEPASAAMRSFNYMNSSRKIAKCHQNVLVFVKGNPIAATERLNKFVDPKDIFFS